MILNRNKICTRINLEDKLQTNMLKFIIAYILLFKV